VFLFHVSKNKFDSHTRPETKEGQQRPMNRTYYYIDYRATIDAIKWRVYQMNKKVQGNTIPEAERKEYFCRRCKSEWTVLEVLDKRGPEGLEDMKNLRDITPSLDLSQTYCQRSTRL
jgi:transcription initiation factor IIE alpha subunit